MYSFFWIILLLNVGGVFVKAKLTEHFKTFLDNTYGKESGNRFERGDLGLTASFGGRQSKNDVIKNQPVIFVHDTTSTAAIFANYRVFLREKGYSDWEMYATTYSDAGKTPSTKNSMCCKDVKLIRDFIVAVHEYSDRMKVDVVGYSMGVAITRKAIMGGSCVDTGEYLGRPLTNIIDTYVGVGGIAYGMQYCPMSIKESCNKVNGMNCFSDYMRDINSKSYRYEGQYSYSIYSKSDYTVGQYCCGHPCSKVKYDNLSVVELFLDHSEILQNTKEVLFTLITNHTNELPSKPKISLPPPGQKYFKDAYFIENNINF